VSCATVVAGDSEFKTVTGDVAGDVAERCSVEVDEGGEAEDDDDEEDDEWLPNEKPHSERESVVRCACTVLAWADPDDGVAGGGEDTRRDDELLAGGEPPAIALESECGLVRGELPEVSLDLSKRRGGNFRWERFVDIT